jgi:hypothetical protein
MNMLHKIAMPVIGVLAALSFQVSSAAQGRAAQPAPPDNTPRSIAPYFKPATAAPKAPDAEGFLQRWLLLDPINKPNRSNTSFVGTYVRAAFNTEYFPDQFTVIPHDGDKVKVGDQELTWHALDSTGFNVKLFRLAYGLNKTTYGGRLKFGVHLVGQRQGDGGPFRRPAHGGGRRGLQTADAEQGQERDSRRGDQRSRLERFLRPLYR